MLYCQIWLTKMHDTDLIRYCGEEHSAAEVQQQIPSCPRHSRAGGITSAAPLCLLLPGVGGEWRLSPSAPPRIQLGPASSINIATYSQ